MVMKLRLRHLLGAKSRKTFSSSRLSSLDMGDYPKNDEVPEAEASSTSSGISQDEDDSCFGPAGDPFADVREQLEELSARDRARHATHHHTNMNDTELENVSGSASASSTSSSTTRTSALHDEEPSIPPFIAYACYLAYAVLILVGHLRDFCAWIFGGRYVRVSVRRAHQKDKTILPSDDTDKFALLLKSWENFYTRRLYARIQDCFNRPICSNPGASIKVLERGSQNGQKSMEILGKWSDLPPSQKAEYSMYDNGGVGQDSKYLSLTDEGVVIRNCLNLGSYNYLGFADDWMTTCAKSVTGSLQSFPISASSSRHEYGTTTLHRNVEEIVANFLGKEDALCLNMGFNTNATTIPALVGRGDLIISDELNHTSIVNGARSSGAAIRIFRHNDTDHLQEILREAIVLGRPRTRRPWNKILVIVEGIYSMEGEYCDLKNVVKVCKQFGAHVYLDEAHSIGAMGATGRGCAEYCGVPTSEIDIMMGTFTKSFGGMGGYIAGNANVINYLRRKCAGSFYHNSLSPVVCQQVITSFKVIMGLDGTNIGKQKLQALRDNSNYFRMRLEQMGLHVLGRYDSPIMPVMLYNPTKIAAFSRECLKRGLAVVVVGFPAVPILMSRARFCISAGHTKADLDRALIEIEEVADICKIRYARSNFG